MRRLIVASAIILFGAGCAQTAVPPNPVNPAPIVQAPASPSPVAVAPTESATEPASAKPVLNYQEVKLTPELIKKYANNADAAPGISTVPTVVKTTPYDLIHDPKISKLLSAVSPGDQVYISAAFNGVQTGSLQYTHDNIKDATVFQAHAPHDYGETVTAIYIPNYQDSFHSTPKDELFVATKAGDGVLLYNVSEKGKSDMTDDLLYFQLSDWSKIKVYDPVFHDTQLFGGTKSQ
jgi:hypothetical protein